MFVAQHLARGLASFSTHVSVRQAGHSKWSNIKHIKGEKDMERSKMIAKMLQRIKVAIQEGGSNSVEHNIQLAQIVEVAQRKNVPLSTIQSCIKSSQVDKSNMKVVWYEIRGPKNSFLIAQGLSEHPKRSKDLMSSIIRRYGGQWAENAGKNIFEQKGVIVASVTEGSAADLLEKAVDDAIECGAEEVEPAENDKQLIFYCCLKDLNIVRTKLEGMNYKIESADFDFIPRMRVELNDKEIEGMSRLLQKIEDHPDIVKVYDNIV